MHKTVLTYLKNILKITLMLGLFYYLVTSGKLDFYQLKHFFQKSSSIYILVFIFILLILSHSIFTLRYRIIIKSANYNLSFFKTMQLILIGIFYNNFLPGGTGGDLMRIYYLKKLTGMPLAIGTAITMLDRIIGLIGLVIVAFFSLTIVTFTNSGSVGDYSTYFWISGLISITVCAFLFSLRYSFFYNFIVYILSKFILSHHTLKFLDVVRNVVTNTSMILKSLGLCLIGHIITILCITLISYSLSGIPGMIASIAVSGIVILSSAVPITPGNLGWTEWLAGTLYSVFGIDNGAAVFVLWRVVSVLFSLIGGIIYINFNKSNTQLIDKKNKPQS